MDELFPIEENKSPRLKWMEKKRIHTIQRPDKTWLAYKSETRHNYSASDEISAVVGLAKKLKLKLWNE